MLVRPVRRWPSAAYSAVVFPDPVGPVTSTRPSGLARLFSEPRERVVVVAQTIERLQRAVAVDHPHHDLLAVNRRQRRESDIDRTSVHFEAERAVLRAVAYRDVRPRHDLETIANRL